jgi:hypothetical protein
LRPAPLRYHAAAGLRRGHPAKTPRAVIAGLLAADVAFAFQQTAVVPAIHSVARHHGAGGRSHRPAGSADPDRAAGLGLAVTVGLLLLTALAAAAWVRLEQKVPDPLIDVHALRTPAVLRADLATVGLGWALFGSYLLVPEFALARPGTSHYGLGAGIAAVGLIMLPLAIGQTVAGPLAGAVSRRVSPGPCSPRAWG